jgi:hypothetical protein
MSSITSSIPTHLPSGNLMISYEFAVYHSFFFFVVLVTQDLEHARQVIYH